MKLEAAEFVNVRDNNFTPDEWFRRRFVESGSSLIAIREKNIVIYFQNSVDILQVTIVPISRREKTYVYSAQ